MHAQYEEGQADSGIAVAVSSRRIPSLSGICRIAAVVAAVSSSPKAGVGSVLDERIRLQRAMAGLLVTAVVSGLVSHA